MISESDFFSRQIGFCRHPSLLEKRKIPHAFSQDHKFDPKRLFFMIMKKKSFGTNAKSKEWHFCIQYHYVHVCRYYVMIFFNFKKLGHSDLANSIWFVQLTSNLSP